MSSEISFDGERVILSVRVVPRASKSELLAGDDGIPRLRIASPPVDGAANDEVVKFISKLFGVSKSSVEILSGEKSRMKRIAVSGASQPAIDAVNEILNGN